MMGSGSELVRTRKRGLDQWYRRFEIGCSSSSTLLDEIASSRSISNRYPGCSLHGVSPYIGKLHPQRARELISAYSDSRDTVWDPFCGSGTIALESQLLIRNVVAGDVNPYACVVTRAKLHAPTSIHKALVAVKKLEADIAKDSASIGEVPGWVSNFFHEQTLHEVVQITRRLITSRSYFLLGCILGILHHQRPGFLSFPASNLAPYLRDRRFPQEIYPEAYEYRDPFRRLGAKVKRALRYPPPRRKTTFRVFEKSVLTKYLKDNSVDCVITSPPYMSQLDYARDNRLRLWFLGVEDYRVLQTQEIRGDRHFESDMCCALRRIVSALKPGGLCVLVLGKGRRGSKKQPIPEIITGLVRSHLPMLKLIEQYALSGELSKSPSRDNLSETILVFRNRKEVR